jgi:hypothetical protein
VFRSYVNECKDDVFEGGAEVIMERLSKAAEAIGHALDSALQKLAEKVHLLCVYFVVFLNLGFLRRSKFPWPYCGKGPVMIPPKFEHASRSLTLSQTSWHKFNSGNSPNK